MSEVKIKLLEEKILRVEKRLNDIHRSRLGLSILGVRNILGQDTEVIGDLYVKGNITSEIGSTVGGVDIGAHVLDINAHHSKMSVADSVTIDFTLTDQQITGSVIQSALDHGLIGGLSDDDHPQYTLKTRQIISGDGLTGGGDLSVDRTLAVGAGIGISVAADSIAINQAANLTWTGNHIFQSGLSTRNITPEMNDTYDLGTSVLLWRKGWLSELDTILFAQNTVTLLGGWFMISKSEGSLPANVAAANTTIDFGQGMTTNDFVLFRSSLQVEYIQVGTLVSGTTYNVTRNLDGSGANDWIAGSPYVVLGYTGNGRIELNAYDTPRISIIEQGATYNAQTERIRIGDLAAWQSAGLTGYGMAMGDYAGGEYLTYSPSGGLVVRGTIRADDGYLQTLTVQGLLSLNTSGELRAGDTTNGLRFGYISDGYYLRGVGGGTTQVEVKASDGKLYAGGGKVILDSNGINMKNATTTGNKEDAASIKFYDASSSLLGDLAFWYGVGGVRWQLGEINRYPATGLPSFIGIGNNVDISGNLNVSSGIDTYGLTLRTNYIFRQTRTDGAIIPISPVGPWTAAAKSYSAWYASYNPLATNVNQFMDESYTARHLTPHVAGQAAAFNTPNAIADYQLYWVVNSTCQYYENASSGSLFNGHEWITIIQWFYPTTISVLQGLFRYGNTTGNCLAYITALNKVVFEIIDTDAATGQIISSNSVNLNDWNYVVYRYQRDGTSYVNLNGTSTTSALAKKYLRSASGSFRLGYDPYGGYFNGALGWFAGSWYISENVIAALIDMSKPWHG